ncbi:hypothetical protein WOLCODRAFT_73218 [Wolfiporia cocos MD-104 SS10]|uniref:Uncharacterized protein n=1 Tax=Wolfiporia cocos (strain MD-104) TaxID=742152 RepID=A0A2H3JJN6_WOLCO|nr:hypothetical protein WOLCODRAFT_73218 [Wolfiporia cocos MD-104 SS10]
MVVHIENVHENRKTEDIAREMIGRRTFIGWPFLQEGMVASVSDSLFKYEKMSVIPGKPAKVVSTPHSPQGLGLWRTKAEKIEAFYSKRCGVITGNVDVLVHVRPLKGILRLDTGALVKDYEDASKETELAVQLTVPEVVSEDPRYLEKDPPSLAEEFPDGSKVFFLGEHAYGIAAQVSSTTTETLSVVLAFFPSEKAENDKFKAIATSRMATRYYPSFKVADMVGLSSRALSRVTSSFMVITSDGHKQNLGLSLKFEGKGMKVIGYSRKDGRAWEFSEKAIDLITEYRMQHPEVMRCLDKGGDAMLEAADIFPGPDADNKVKEVKAWLTSKGVRDFEPVSLFCDQLKKETVKEIEALEDQITATKSAANIKKAVVKGIPRQAVLKPSHAVYRLQNQHFALGDRVTMVQDSGSVPLSVKGVVIGMNAKSMDVVWDAAFMSGTTLGDRCSPYRGATVEFTSCLNLSNPQFIASTNPKEPTQQKPSAPFKPRFGPYPAVQPPPGQQAVAGFRHTPQTQAAPVHIMTNPNRGRDSFVNGHHPPPVHPRGGPGHHPRGMSHAPPVAPRGGFIAAPRGRGGFAVHNNRGRGAPPHRGGVFRGRGSRGAHTPPAVPS